VREVPGSNPGSALARFWSKTISSYAIFEARVVISHKKYYNNALIMASLRGAIGSAVNRKVGGSSPPGGDCYYYQFPFLQAF